jgi:hypothetical protein
MKIIRLSKTAELIFEWKTTTHLVLTPAAIWFPLGVEGPCRDLTFAWLYAGVTLRLNAS